MKLMPLIIRAVLISLLAAPHIVSAFETVVIDPGHGGGDEGTDWHHTQEKTVTLSIAKRLENILHDAGIHTVMTRRYDHYVSLDERTDMANRHPNSLMLSIHLNGASTQSTTGFEIYHFAPSPSGQFIAEAITEAFVEKSLGRNRGTHTQDYAVLVRTNDLSVLVECGFISNKT
ncbi:MAG: N-acetylmuramoyl-L-alanine amidase, partial [Verrucomicrobiaceae bacterium]